MVDQPELAFLIQRQYCDDHRRIIDCQNERVLINVTQVRFEIAHV